MRDLVPGRVDCDRMGESWVGGYLRAVRRPVPLLFAATLLVACSGSGAGTVEETGPSDTTGSGETTSPSETETSLEQGAATTTSTEPATPTTEADAESDVSQPVLGNEILGRWAHYDVVAYEDGLLKTLIVSYGFNDFTESAGEIIDSARFCFSEQRTDQPIETGLSDAATQAIKPPSTPVDVDVVDGMLRVRRPATPTPVGIRLDDPANESLPTDPDDPRVVDDDGDGKPGITVNIRVSDELSGELYLARREIFAYEVLLVEPDLMTGTVADESEQLVLGASDPIFASSDANWVQHPDLTKSPIVLKRVDDDWGCDRLAAERDRLFPPTPDVDW